MNRNLSAAELIDELEWLYEKYSNEVRSATQPYYLKRVSSEIEGYEYNPDANLVRENLLEHVGALPMIATTIYPYIKDPTVNLGEALIMLAVHDIGELVTHDVNTFVKKDTEKQLEQGKALELLHSNYHDLYNDIETQTSQTAKFAKAVDKIAGDLMDYITPAEITIPRLKHFVGVEADEIVPLIVKHKRPYMLWNPFMTELHKELICKLEQKLQAAAN